MAVATNIQPETSKNELLHRVAQTITQDDNPDDGDDRSPPPDPATVPQVYLFASQAILAIVKSWDVGTYDPPGTDRTSWLYRVHNLCSEQYSVPVSQRALCAAHRMRPDCEEATHAAGYYEMT